MKRLLGILIVTVCLLMITGCQSSVNKAHIPIPVKYSPMMVRAEAPDDIIPTPGGSAYRANVHEVGIENPWPSIETVEVQLVSGSNTIHVRYRNNIVTKAGETRYNILNVRKEGGFFEDASLSNMKLYSVGTLSGLKLSQTGGGGFPGTIASVLVIEIPQDIKPGQYNLEIGLEILGTDYGTIPCTINVIQ